MNLFSTQNVIVYLFWANFMHEVDFSPPILGSKKQLMVWIYLYFNWYIATKAYDSAQGTPYLGHLEGRQI